MVIGNVKFGEMYKEEINVSLIPKYIWEIDEINKIK